MSSNEQRKCFIVCPAVWRQLISPLRCIVVAVEVRVLADVCFNDGFAELNACREYLRRQTTSESDSCRKRYRIGQDIYRAMVLT